jgi:prophage regulatory protein
MRILRRPAVIERTGLSNATIHRREQAGDFPARVKLGPNSIGWIEHEIDAWIESRRVAPRVDSSPTNNAT